MSAPGLFDYLCRLGDDRLVLGHRLSEWCGHGPILEEDIALANIALDLVGQANLLLGLAATVEGKGRTADDLAFMRDGIDYRNVLLAELPRGDFAQTMVRQFFFGVFSFLQMRALEKSSNGELAGIAAKGVKESRYHVRHCGEWLLMMGDGTEESHERAQRAVNELWPYTGEMFLADDVDREVASAGIGVDPSTLHADWSREVGDVIARATLQLPAADTYMQRGGRTGRHTEHLGRMLGEMQILQRTHPGAQW